MTAYANLTEKETYELARDVVDRADSVTQADCEFVANAGLVVWETDIDGLYPSPTDRYIELMDLYDPIDPENVIF